MSKDYYKILGVDKKASAEDIKKAFRKLAHQCHPDKAGGDEKKFKEINEAYQVLGNDDKRRRYDQYGTDFEQMGGFGGGTSWDDFMRAARGQAGGFGNNGGQSFNFGNVDLGDLFGDFFGFGGSQSESESGWNSGTRSAGKGQDIHLRIELTFEEAALGTEKILLIEKMVVCKECKGTGAASGSELKVCQNCGGRGRVRKVSNFLFGQFETEAICPECQGRGKTPEKKCSNCKGKGIVKERMEVKVKFPAGIDSGESLRLREQGNAGEYGASAGDLYLTVKIKPHSKLKRNGYDVISEEVINYSQLVLGDIIKVQTLDGEILLKIPAGTASGQAFKLRGHGIKSLRHNGKGDHLVVVRLDTPQKLTKKQKEILENLSREGL